MSKQLTKINEWIAQGFISTEQGKLIHEYESNKESSSWILYGFLLLGAIIIGIGLISVVAANWMAIPGSLKLAVDFILLTGLAWGIHESSKRDKWVLFEVLNGLYVVLVLASIGLISQVYHTGGKLYQALLLWSALTVAPTLISRKTFVPLIWGAGFFGSLCIWVFESGIFGPIFNKSELYFFSSIPLFSWFLALIFQRVKNGGGQANAFRAIAFISALISMVSVEVFKPYYNFPGESLLPIFVSFALCALMLILSKDYKRGQKLALSGAIILFVTCHLLPIVGFFGSITSAGLSISILSLVAIHLASVQMKRMFNFILVLVGVRFVVLYFQAFGGLATTGIGLIVSGGIVIGLVILWSKYRQRLSVWAEGVLK